MGILFLRIQHSAKEHAKYVMAIAALTLFVVGVVWFDYQRSQDFFMSSYHGAFVSTEHDCFIKANVSFDIDDRITLIKIIQEKNACQVGDDFIRAESYLEIKTLSLEKNTFAKVAITGIIELKDGRKTFHESHAMPIALQRNHDQLVLVVSYNDIFPFNQLGKEVNDKLVFILNRDR